LEKTSLVKAEPPNAMLEVACLIDSIPSMVMGQLFMKLAPTVTIMLGATTPRTNGNVLDFTNAEAKKSVTPALVKP
jgi:hypothetical protein